MGTSPSLRTNSRSAWVERRLSASLALASTTQAELCRRGAARPAPAMSGGREHEDVVARPRRRCRRSRRRSLLKLPRHHGDLDLAFVDELDAQLLDRVGLGQRVDEHLVVDVDGSAHGHAEPVPISSMAGSLTLMRPLEKRP